MRYRILSILLMVTAITSCIQISGLTSGFSHLTKQQQERVVAYKGRIADIHDYSYVYAVAVEQVKEFLSTHEKVLVYDFTPFCTSDNCISPDKLKDLCSEKGVELLVISNIYDDIFQSLSPRFPMLIINMDEYGTKRRSKYIDAFYVPLLGKNQKEIDYALYHYFYKGTYLGSFKSIKDIKELSGAGAELPLPLHLRNKDK